MRLQRYLKESYVDTFRNYEVFVNPSRKELKDATDVSGYGYRFIIDFKQKKFYAWSDQIFHEFVWEWLRTEKGHKELPTFDRYWYNGINGDRFFTGSVDKGGSHVDSDHTYFIHSRNKHGDRIEFTNDKTSLADIYLTYDLSWLSKYVNLNSIKALFKEEP